MDKLKYDYKAYFSVAKKIKFRVKSFKNKFLRKISRISGNYGSKCVKKRKSNKAVGKKNDDSLNVMKNFVNCFAVFYN